MTDNIKKALDVLPSEIARLCEARIQELEALKQAREKKGFTSWTGDGPCYATEIQKLWKGIRAGLDHYAEVYPDAMEGKNRKSPEYLQRVVDIHITPVLRLNLADPKFHPIDPAAFPNPDYLEICQTSGRKITNRHEYGGVTVQLEWSYNGQEPSYWLAFDDRTWRISSRSRRDAILQLQYGYIQESQEKHRNRTTRFRFNDLTVMPGYKVERIAKDRGIPCAGAMKKRELIKQIVCPQHSLF